MEGSQNLNRKKEGLFMAKKMKGRPRKCDNDPGSKACIKMQKNSPVCKVCTASSK